MEKRASRTLSSVGRTPLPAGVRTRRPLRFPPVIRIRKSTTLPPAPQSTIDTEDSALQPAESLSSAVVQEAYHAIGTAAAFYLNIVRVLDDNANPTEGVAPMGWFRKTRKKKTAVEKEDLWNVCPSCTAHVFKEEWESNLRVCPQCNFHERISCRDRLRLLIDPETFEEFDKDIQSLDPLEFADAKGSYVDKATATRKKTGLNESIMTGRGKINELPVVIAIMDFQFFGGSLGSGTGEKIYLAADYALRHRRPFVIVCTSGGARMQEGIVSLMQMAKTCAAVARLNKAGLPYISILTDPTYGGVSASYGMVGDLNIAEPGARIGFAGRNVIEQTIKQKLPKEFQTAEHLMQHGFIDHIVNRSEMKDFLHRVLQYWNPK